MLSLRSWAAISSANHSFLTYRLSRFATLRYSWSATLSNEYVLTVQAITFIWTLPI